MRHLRFWARVLFVAGCLVLLVVGLTASTSTSAQGEHEQRFTALLGVMMLGFPTAFLGSGFVSDLFGSALFNVTGTLQSFVRDWAIAAALGYVQWFVILPFVIRAIARIFGMGRRQGKPEETNSG